MAALPVVPADAIDGAWMTQALRQDGLDVTVSAVSSVRVGSGQVGETRRFTLTYSGDIPAHAPATVIGKFPSGSDESREAARMFGIYKAEAAFYDRLADTAGIRVAHCHAAPFDDATHDFVLLLEDMHDLVQGDQMAGCTIDQAALVLEEAARLHASHWQDPALAAADWLLVPETAQAFYTADLMAQLWPGFVARYAERVGPAALRLAEAFIQAFAAWNAPAPRPHALAHNDFRPDNMLFGARDGEPVMVTVDWQTMNFGYGAFDVAYFVGGALSPADRAAAEGALLRDYHANLVAHGVSDYPFDRFMTDYRHYTFGGVMMAVGSAMLVGQTERGDRMFLTMLERAARHAIDLDALAVIPR
ncbi:oxidoreductase family protein [Zavarzinia sp. CC-PAN008]|uniref:oxidoreductase family protein n=1 Tax=Zavarzinia sp. CC-PAN008 TaxID=3243332 RepID=UPI003F745C86